MKDKPTQRIVYPEHEHIKAGKLGHGSPTWSRAITWFRRPKDVTMPNHKSKPVSSLQNVAAFYNRKPAQAKAEQVVIPDETKCEKSMPSIDAVFAVQKSYWERLGMPLMVPAKPKAAKDKLVAVMEYSHKTAGHSVVMTKEQAAEFKRRVRRRGYGTCLRFDPKT